MDFHLRLKEAFLIYFFCLFFRYFRRSVKSALFLIFVLNVASTKIYAHDQTLTYLKVLFASSKVDVSIVVPKENIADIIKLQNKNEGAIDTVFFIEYFKNHFEILNDHEKCIPELIEVNLIPEVNSYSFEFEFACDKLVNKLLITYNLFFEISETHSCVADFILEDQQSEITFSKSNNSIEIPVDNLMKKWANVQFEKKDTENAEKIKTHASQVDSSSSFRFKKSTAPGTVFSQSEIKTDTIQKRLPSVLSDPISWDQTGVPHRVLIFKKQSWWQIGSGFFILGIKHILTGYDHLLFLLGLLLISVKLFDVLKIVTSFTIAHSITLILAALEIFVLPARLTESLIALSISYIAFENIFLLQKKFTPKVQRWLITFFFGLVHGFGFSSVLREIGLPKDGLVTALLSFNVGIETGQLLIVILLLPLLIYIRKKTWSLSFIKVCSIIIGSLGIFWFFQRAFCF